MTQFTVEQQNMDKSAKMRKMGGRRRLQLLQPARYTKKRQKVSYVNDQGIKRRPKKQFKGYRDSSKSRF